MYVFCVYYHLLCCIIVIIIIKGIYRVQDHPGATNAFHGEMDLMGLKPDP